MVKSQEPAETIDLDPVFLSRELVSQGTISYANHRRNVFMPGTEYSGATAQPRDHIPACQHLAEITQLHTFAALIRLSTTTHNLPTSNASEISSNNLEKLSLLADKQLWTFLLYSS